MHASIVSLSIGQMIRSRGRPAACRTRRQVHLQSEPMRILIANDDGYLAPGLAALVEACEGLGEIDVVAPEQNASGTSNSLTLQSRPVVLHRGNGFRYINGTPSDCVHLALTGLLEQRPDLVVSGINNGANMGDDTLYSGTVAAAMEGYLFGIPAIAFSQVEKGWAHLDAAARVARSRHRAACCAARRLRRRGCSTSTFRTGPMPTACPLQRQPPGPTTCQRAGDPPDQPARRHAVLDRRRGRCARGRADGTDFHATANGARVDHAAAGRPDRPRHPAGLARLARQGIRVSAAPRAVAEVSAAPGSFQRAAGAGARRDAAPAATASPAPHADAARQPGIGGLGLDSAGVRAPHGRSAACRGASRTTASSARWPRSSGIGSSTARSSPRPTRTRACRSATGQTISKPSVVARMIELLFGGANARRTRRAGAGAGDRHRLRLPGRGAVAGCRSEVRRSSACAACTTRRANLRSAARPQPASGVWRRHARACTERALRQHHRGSGWEASSAGLARSTRLGGRLVAPVADAGTTRQVLVVDRPDAKPATTARRAKWCSSSP